MNLEPKLEPSLILEDEDLRKRRVRAPLHIQIVDDDEVTQQLVHTLLARHYHVTISKNVHEAVNDYMRITPDLVFLDINLGDVQHNGFSILHTIQMMDWDANIVMLSGNGSPQNIAEATRQGAMGFITKPFSREILMRYVKECEERKTTPWN